MKNFRIYLFVFITSVTLFSCEFLQLLQPTTTTTKEDATTRLRKDVTQHSKQYVGTRYKYAGKAPKTGFDCSGFTSYVYSQFDVDLSSSSSTQATQGSKVSIEDVKAGDLVFVLAAKKHIKKMMEQWYKGEKPANKIIIAGGGNIGFNLAKALERDHSVKIIEYNKDRSRFIAEELTKALVIRGDCTSEEILHEENINHADIFCALTNDDQANLLAALLAKKLGAKKVMTLINKQSYAQLIEKDTIDIAVSPQHITMGGILAHVRGDYTARVHSLRQGAAEAIEVEVKGDVNSSKVVGKLVQNINLPLGCTIGGIVRNNKVIMAHRNLVIEHLDHIIMFVTDKRNINDLKRLFEVDASFL